VIITSVTSRFSKPGPKHSADDMGRPMFAPPGMPADRLKTLRDAFAKTMQDEQFRAEVKKRGYEFDPVTGEELEKLAKT